MQPRPVHSEAFPLHFLRYSGYNNESSKKNDLQ